ncbi:jg1670 [Pararge aegeria aegeria]|uniref:Jg1670 protein n=2 Tax=Pararge aegeria TaxID=116150 RepID=A0A8S4REG4_9NEOP|nr:jg1670 [Pararge aegeria aegeria]
MNPEEEENETPSFKSTRGTSIICAPQTPCAWYIYNAYSKVISSNITNSYCVCGPGTTCEISENDETGNTYIYRCRETPES